MKEISSQSNLVNNSQVQKAPKKHRVLKTAAFLGTAALVGGAVYFHKNPAKLEVFANALNDKVIAPLKQKDVPVREKIQTVIHNIVSTTAPKVKQVIDKAENNPELKELGEAAKNLIKGGALVIASFLGGTAAASASNDDKKETVEEAAFEEEEFETAEAMEAGGSEAVEEETVVEAANAGEAEEVSVSGFEIKTSDGKPFKGAISLKDMKDADGKPMQGSLNINYEDGKRVILLYENGTLTQSKIFEGEDSKTPQIIKNYNKGTISSIHNDIVAKKGKDYVSRETSTIQNSSLTKKVIVKDGKAIEQHFIQDLDKNGKVQGKPIHLFSVVPEFFKDGSKKRTFSIPTEDGDRLIRISENSNGNKKITLMSFEQQPIAVITSEKGKAPSKYTLHVDGGKFDGSIGLDDGKIGDMKNLFFDTIDVEPETGDCIISFKSETLEGAGLKVTTDNNDMVTKIAAYSDMEKSVPDCETTFVNGMPQKDFFFDESGKTVFSSKYAHKK